MKILGIAGSLREGSYNRQLLRLAAENLPDGVELSVWEGLRDVPAFDQDEESSPPFVVAGFRSAVAAADAVLIATPSTTGRSRERSRTLSIGARGRRPRVHSAASRSR